MKIVVTMALILAGVTAIMSGCTMFPEFVIANHSGSTVTVVAGHRNYLVTAGATVAIIDAGLSNGYEVRRGAERWRLGFPWPTEGYLERGAFRDRIRVWLARDLRVCLCRNEAEQLLAVPPPQPRGFPQRPAPAR